VVAVVSRDNKGSIRVLEKAGMRLERMLALESEEPEVCLYGLDLSGA
jgi:RimJ/RimL family protein N-acetyltransferase